MRTDRECKFTQHHSSHLDPIRLSALALTVRLLQRVYAFVSHYSCSHQHITQRLPDKIPSAERRSRNTAHKQTLLGR